MGDEALADSVEGLQSAGARVAGEKLRRLAELDARKAYRGRGMSTADWMAPRLGLSRGQAKAETDTAAALERLPRTARRLRAGELGQAQVRQAARGLAQLDRLADAGEAVPADAAGQLDEQVASSGPKATAGQVRTRVDETLNGLSPAALDARERRAHARRHAWIGRDGDGYRFEGRLGAAAGAHLATAINARSTRWPARPAPTMRARPASGPPTRSRGWVSRRWTPVGCPRSPPSART